MKKEKPKVNVVFTFSEGWEERFAEAAYKLYLKVEQEETRSNKKTA